LTSDNKKGSSKKEIGMRAVYYEEYGDISVLELGETSKRNISDDEILIRVRAASLNPFDWKLRNGMLRSFFESDFPITPGRDGCGEIVELGNNVRDLPLDEGQRVSFISSRLQHGSMADYAAVFGKNNVVPAADNLSVQESAAIPLVGLSAWNAMVDTAEIHAGMRVLIHGGSGGVGSVAIQIAQHFGADVYATCNSANVDIVEKLGAHAIPYDLEDFTNSVADCDVVFDTVGGQVHQDSYKVLKRGGRLVYLLAKPFDDLSGDYGVEDIQVNVFGHTANLAKVIDFASKGIIKPLIGHSLRLSDFRQAFELGESGKAGGKIVLAIPA
jgi:NADPH:quinone reductase-like Zn-dependent oxidoreductase